MDLISYYSSTNTQLLGIIQAIASSSIEIEECIRFSALKNLKGDHSNDQQNSSGDVQKKLDVIANDIMIKHLTATKYCNILLSEENDQPIYIPKEKRSGSYLVAFDPLDGSSNIDCNAPIGTIFSISPNEKDQILLEGKDIVVAGYILYGPSTELVLSVPSLTKDQPNIMCSDSVKNTVDRFVLSPSKKYIHVEKIQLKGKKKIYSINDANSNSWNTDIKSYIESYKVVGTKYTSRYIGSMVGDVHRTLLYGGVFSYPADKKNPNGKLRLLYEAYPMAKLVEDAGGKAIVGNMCTTSILDVKAKEIHQRTPILLGSIEEVNKYGQILAKL